MAGFLSSLHIAGFGPPVSNRYSANSVHSRVSILSRDAAPYVTHAGVENQTTERTVMVRLHDVFPPRFLSTEPDGFARHTLGI
ncbi:MAG: hypothetical protein KGQ47_09085 [Hyphomicrobiales bacterium]|nr:hypothetical protein [Hyphomicrobiales bacterium]